jgi:serine/threonine protein kinase/tetratricopeptide (TPR) repeat protein
MWDMTPERFEQIERLYHAVREGTPEQRAALVAQADPEVRREVELLLSQSSRGEFLGAPALKDAAELLTDATGTPTAPGTSLGPYRIERKLGEGGMGEVFRAVDTRLGRAVAVKVTHEQFGARFEREVRAISSLNHPNICTLYDVGPNYLVMELVEGETLAALLKRGALSVPNAILYASQIAAALAEAHAKGIVHRDLKPGNIMIARSGVKVLDFGLATLEGDQTLTGKGVVMGTPAYMAPEQREGKASDARTDIYGLGCVLHEMLTGERASFRRLRIRGRRLETIVSRCLEENPALRWQSVTELQRELDGVSRPSGGGKSKAPSTLTALEPTRKFKIVVSEFENKTGDPVFDKLLRDGLSLEMGQSPFLTLVSDQQVQQTLRLMRRPPETRLTPDIAVEICERVGGTAVLEGSMASLGSRYVLWIRARNCRTGDILGHEQAQAGKKEEVLKVFTRIAVQIRARLGESLATIDEPLPLQPSTTPSLEALKASSAARAMVYKRGVAAAMPHLLRAIAIDPQFAMAHAEYAFYCGNTGQTDRAREHALKAYELLDGVSEWERFYILFVYHRQVTGNAHKELENIEVWVQTYPDEFHAWGVLAGWSTRGTGQYERGVQAAEECIRLNAGIPFPYEGLAVHNTSLGRFAAASDALRRAAELQIEIPNFLVARYYLAFLEGDDGGMKREIDRARGQREAEDWMSHHQALVLARCGKMRSARTMWHHAILRARQNGDPGRAAIYQAAAAVCEAHLGYLPAAKERGWAALELRTGRDVKYAAAFALALSGDKSGPQTLAGELATEFPEDTPVQFEYLPILRALFALSQKAPLDAIEHLQTAIPYDLAMPGTAFFGKFGGLYSAYVRGLACQEAERGRQAAAEFQKVLDHPGIVLADPIGALARLQLGRALVLSGEKDRARGAYQDFLTLWKDADEDIPILKQASSEYAKL